MRGSFSDDVGLANGSAIVLLAGMKGGCKQWGAVVGGAEAGIAVPIGGGGSPPMGGRGRPPKGGRGRPPMGGRVHLQW